MSYYNQKINNCLSNFSFNTYSIDSYFLAGKFSQCYVNTFSCQLANFVIFLIPSTRKNFITLNIGAVLIYFGVAIEKGIGLIIPGFTPDTLGEIYEYFPSRHEIFITMGIFSLGFLIYTFLLKVAVPIILGDFNYKLDFNKKEHVPNEIVS